MPRIKITDEAHTLIRSQMTNPPPFPPRDGTDWLIDIEWSTIETLREVAFPGESISDTIVRMFATLKGKN